MPKTRPPYPRDMIDKVIGLGLSEAPDALRTDIRREQTRYHRV